MVFLVILFSSLFVKATLYIIYSSYSSIDRIIVSKKLKIFYSKVSLLA